MIDTYWSDHCRHTTFGTILDDVQIDDAVVQEAFDRYMALREETGRTEKPRCLMDVATMGARALKQRGVLTNLDESDEINACTVKIKCDVDGEDQDWLFLFKNETHNHPTEIEPFGGAATCIGGAIRDPPVRPQLRLSGHAGHRRGGPPGPGQRDPARQAAPSASWSPPRRRAIPPTATRSAWPPARWMRSTTPAMWPSGWRSARWWAPPPPAMSGGSAPPPAT